MIKNKRCRVIQSRSMTRYIFDMFFAMRSEDFLRFSDSASWKDFYKEMPILTFELTEWTKNCQLLYTQEINFFFIIPSTHYLHIYCFINELFFLPLSVDSTWGSGWALTKDIITKILVIYLFSWKKFINRPKSTFKTSIFLPDDLLLDINYNQYAMDTCTGATSSIVILYKW